MQRYGNVLSISFLPLVSRKGNTIFLWLNLRTNEKSKFDCVSP